MCRGLHAYKVGVSGGLRSLLGECPQRMRVTKIPMSYTHLRVVTCFKGLGFRVDPTRFLGSVTPKTWGGGGGGGWALFRDSGFPTGELLLQGSGFRFEPWGVPLSTDRLGGTIIPILLVKGLNPKLNLAVPPKGAADAAALC